jgi:DNA-binding transcriptional regulator YdaS (Cro superfamily)
VPVSAPIKVAALAQDLGSQRRLAELLGVSPAQVSRWQRGQGIDPLNADRLDLLDLVVSRLLRMYPAPAALRWLTGLNPHLGDRRPVDLVISGQTRDLLDALDQERVGSFS